MAQDIRIPRSTLRAAGLVSETPRAPQTFTASLVAGVAAPFGDAQASLLTRLSAGRHAIVRPERHALRQPKR
jgi:hypothetical protein